MDKSIYKSLQRKIIINCYITSYINPLTIFYQIFYIQLLFFLIASNSIVPILTISILMRHFTTFLYMWFRIKEITYNHECFIMFPNIIVIWYAVNFDCFYFTGPSSKFMLMIVLNIQIFPKIHKQWPSTFNCKANKSQYANKFWL